MAGAVAAAATPERRIGVVVGIGRVKTCGIGDVVGYEGWVLGCHGDGVVVVEFCEIDA